MKSKFWMIGMTITTLFLAACSSEPAEPGEYAELAKCLTEKGAIMYGADWCQFCTQQKEAFGPDFQFVTYQECDPAYGGDRQACLAAGVSSYPTWAIPGQQNLVGTQPLEELARRTNCTDTLPGNASQQEDSESDQGGAEQAPTENSEETTNEQDSNQQEQNENENTDQQAQNNAVNLEEGEVKTFEGVNEQGEKTTITVRPVID